MISVMDSIPIQTQYDLISEMPDLKSFDLYTHLKLNVKDFEKNCKDNPDNFENYSFYCITCKLSICDLCNYEIHKNHFLIKKSNFEMERDTINKIFEQLENNINSNDIFTDTTGYKEELKLILTHHFNKLQNKLEEIKEMKYKEIDDLYSDNSSVTQLKKNIDDIKLSIFEFFEKNKKFFNYDKFNNDSENTVFLITFEMLNNCIQKNKEICSTLGKLNENCRNYQEGLINKITAMLQSLEDFDKKEEKENTEEQLQPITTISTKFDALNGDYFKDIKLRIKKYNEHINNFKTLAFDTIMKTGSVKEIEKIISLFDKKNEKGIAFIFNNELPDPEFSKSPNFDKKALSKVDTSMRENNNSITSNSTAKNSSRINTEIKLKNPSSAKKLTNYGEDDSQSVYDSKQDLLQNWVLSIKNKNDIRLDNRVIQRYFSYATVDVVNKNFRIKTNTNITSATNLFIKPGFEMEEEGDICKPIIGTNEIHIYDRKKRMLIKKKITLEKQLHGFTTFLDGMRHLLVNDKLFITGGRDPNQEHSVVLIYDVKEFQIKRVADMKVPHSYHTLEYNDIFKTLLVIGGQNNKSCEMFDLFTNRWRLLPELNFPRANISAYFDTNENLVYALFGIKGDISQSTNHTDVIEVLDLQDMNKGWIKLDYNNKSEMDFKQGYCGVFPISKNKLLIYGAGSSRNNAKNFALFLMNKGEIIQVEKKLLEEMRMQTRTSAKLSKILSTVTTK